MLLRNAKLTKYKTLAAICDKEELDSVKELFKIFKDKLTNLKIGAQKYGDLKNKIIITFRIAEDQFNLMVQKLIYNNIKVINNDEGSLKIIHEAKAEFTRMQKRGYQGWNDVKIDKNIITTEMLNGWAASGNFRNIIMASKDVTGQKKEIIEKAKQLITPTIEKAINTAHKEAIDAPLDASKALTRLLNIASDPSLKAMNKNDQIKIAGGFAIDFCVKHKKFRPQLIAICNNSQIHYFTNIQAAIKLAKYIFSEDREKEIVDLTAKQLNIKWLNIAVEIVSNNFSYEEIKIFNELIDFVKGKRAY
ncbi:MAG: hypothetical protein JEY94_01700 [Melioribacteraceae bacterium]|nr:hypothetical protein [Melioribacteraceae bacterium]